MITRYYTVLVDETEFYAEAEIDCYESSTFAKMVPVVSNIEDVFVRGEFPRWIPARVENHIKKRIAEEVQKVVNKEDFSMLLLSENSKSQ